MLAVSFLVLLVSCVAPPAGNGDPALPADTSAPPVPTVSPDPPAATFPGPALGVSQLSSHALAFSVDRWAGAEVTISCVGAGETHIRAATARIGVAIDLRGLLADQPYRCRAMDAAGRLTEVDITTSPAEHPLPAFTVTGDPDALGGRYVLLNVFVDGLEANQQQIVIIDAAGRPRWSSWIGDNADGDVDSSWLGDDQVLYGGGYGVTPKVVNLDGTVAWEAPDAPTSRAYHHQARAAADGSVIAMTLSDDVYGGSDYPGHWIGAWSPTGELAWSWGTAQAVEQGVLVPDVEAHDSFHVNAAVEVDWPPCDLLVSMRNVSTLMCVERATGTVVWTLAEDYTLVDEAGHPLPDDWTNTQHDPEPDGDRLLVFDNGGTRSGAVRTRVVEYELDHAARTARLLWSYSEPGWDEPIWGGARRYGEGRVLVALPHCMNCSSMSEDSDTRSALIALDADHNPAWRLAFVDETVGLYRASLIEPCAIFDNRRYCPDE